MGKRKNGFPCYFIFLRGFSVLYKIFSYATDGYEQALIAEQIVVLENSKLKGSNINNTGYISSTNLELQTPTLTNSGRIEVDNKAKLCGGGISIHDNKSNQSTR